MRKFRGHLKISFSYSEHLGGRIVGAGVSLRLMTHDDYKFVNSAHWSESDFGNIVEKGVKDGLVESGYDPDLGIHIVLENIEYDPVDSSEHSFYVASKAAVKARDILMQ